VNIVLRLPLKPPPLDKKNNDKYIYNIPPFFTIGTMRKKMVLLWVDIVHMYRNIKENNKITIIYGNKMMKLVLI
jgi:hypothetical protein